jgi:hypothetical protein
MGGQKYHSIFKLNTKQYWKPVAEKFHEAPGEKFSTEISIGLIPRALFLGEMRNISPVSFEL